MPIYLGLTVPVALNKHIEGLLARYSRFRDTGPVNDGASTSAPRLNIPFLAVPTSLM